MLKALSLSIALSLSATSAIAQQYSETENRIRGAYAQLGNDTGIYLCEAFKLYADDNEKVALYVNARLTEDEGFLVSGILNANENNPYREIFEFFSWKAFKQTGCGQ
jgi:hypothetical protein